MLKQSECNVPTITHNQSQRHSLFLFFIYIAQLHKHHHTKCHLNAHAGTLTPPPPQPPVQMLQQTLKITLLWINTRSQLLHPELMSLRGVCTWRLSKRLGPHVARALTNIYTATEPSPLPPLRVFLWRCRDISHTFVRAWHTQGSVGTAQPHQV